MRPPAGMGVGVTELEGVLEGEAPVDGEREVEAVSVFEGLGVDRGVMGGVLVGDGVPEGVMEDVPVESGDRELVLVVDGVNEEVGVRELVRLDVPVDDVKAQPTAEGVGEGAGGTTSASDCAASPSDRVQLLRTAPSAARTSITHAPTMLLGSENTHSVDRSKRPPREMVRVEETPRSAGARPEPCVANPSTAADMEEGEDGGVQAAVMEAVGVTLGVSVPLGVRDGVGVVLGVPVCVAVCVAL